MAKTHAALPYAQQEFRKKDMLSCEEILYWLRELSKNPHWGWARNRTNLARALGWRKNPKQCMDSKLRGGWIYPTEQVRLSERIQMVLAGNVIPNYEGRKASFEYVNPPRPPVKPPAKYRVSLGKNGPMFHVAQFKPPTATLPDFKSVFAKARLWKTD